MHDFLTVILNFFAGSDSKIINRLVSYIKCWSIRLKILLRWFIREFCWKVSLILSHHISVAGVDGIDLTEFFHLVCKVCNLSTSSNIKQDKLPLQNLLKFSAITMSATSMQSAQQAISCHKEVALPAYTWRLHDAFSSTINFNLPS